MAAAAHSFPGYNNLLTTKSANYSNLSGSTKLGAVLISAGTFNWVAATQAYTTLAQFIANAGSGGGGALTESTGTGYSRGTLSSVTCSTSGLVTTLSHAALTYTASTITALYLVVYDFTLNTTNPNNNTADASHQLVAYQDFGGPETDTAGTWSFTPSGSGLVTWTAS